MEQTEPDKKESEAAEQIARDDQRLIYPLQRKRNFWILISVMALVLAVGGVLLVVATPGSRGSDMSLEQLAKLTVDAIFAPPNKNPHKTEWVSPTPKKPEVSEEGWATWAVGVEDKAYDALAVQGVKLTQNSESGDAKLPSLSLVNGKPSFGVAAADAAYLHNKGALTGKIALFQEIATDSMRLPYNSKAQYSLHDEVVDRTPYLDDQHQAPMPFIASRYAQKPQECDTLVIIRSFMVKGVKADVNGYTMYVDTEVIIINARTGRLQHIEYLGKCLADKNAPVARDWMMRGEAMQYLASLSVDGKASKTPYIIPYESGSAKTSDTMNKLLDATNRADMWIATGQFGQYNTLILGDNRRNTPIVSQQKVKTFAVRLYNIQGGKIISSMNYRDVELKSPAQHALVARFAEGKATLTGNVEVQTFPGVLTLSGDKPVSFTATAAEEYPCQECKGSGEVNDKTCPHCGGIGLLVRYEGLLL